MSPTQRTLTYLRKQGYLAQVVEKFNSFAKIRIDLFGCIDVLAVHPDRPGVLGVQCCRGKDTGRHFDKCRVEPRLKLFLLSQNNFEIHGWYQRRESKTSRRSKYHLQTLPITLEDFQPVGAVEE